MDDGRGGVLVDLNVDPMATEWWREGRPATREEVLESIASGLPILADMAKRQGPSAQAALSGAREAAERWMPLAGAQL